MTPTLSLLRGHNLEQLATLPPDSLQACVTSPPYYGLREYGIPPAHFPPVEFIPVAGLPSVSIPEWDGELGQERDPWDYVGHLVQVFREVRRVLRKDGTLWLNLGDSYASTSTYNAPRTSSGAFGRVTSAAQPNAGIPKGMKAKDLIGIPWRAAQALQADGWLLRSSIIWHKPNPMPESVTDRPTRAHEYVFLFAREDPYFYNLEALQEDVTNRNPTGKNSMRGAGSERDGVGGPSLRPGRDMREEVTGGERKNCRSVWSIPTRGYSGAHFATMAQELARRCVVGGTRPGDSVLDPFGGSGTTGKVALENGRSAVLVEIGEQYQGLIDERCHTTPSFAL